MSKPNRLQHETSPYLQQHALNPVDWYPWGTEALSRAKRENKPIFLSIGYSACHWCHVMERESFEDAATAAILNQSFISIKVDKEERPDIDHIYMTAVQLLTQHGGWPLTVFLTPNLEPFYGGTYFPPVEAHGRPSFKRVLTAISDSWKGKNNEILQSAKQLTESIQHYQSMHVPSSSHLKVEWVENARQISLSDLDANYGGFGSAPKFFHPFEHRLLLSDPKTRPLAINSLLMIARGGIYDHLGGGFHRYSTDALWLVPHFEKMLYDNALLLELYSEAYRCSPNPEISKVLFETGNYVLREMTSGDGHFFSTQDADSEGEEGKFFVWTKEEIESVLSPELAVLFCEIYGVTAQGNWEGKSILNRVRIPKESEEDDLALATRKLFQARAHRIAPHRDEKVLTNWNGLMIHALAVTANTLQESTFLAAAQTAATRLLEDWKKLGFLVHSQKDGKYGQIGFLDDYASLIQALTTLYESDFNETWLKEAEKLSYELIERFFESHSPIPFFASKDHSDILLRPVESYDGATPSAVSVTAHALLKLGKLLGIPIFQQKAVHILEAFANTFEKHPQGHGHLLWALDMHLKGTTEIAFAAGENPEENDRILQQLRSRYLPHQILAKVSPFLSWTDKKIAINGQATVYQCKDFVCEAPTVGGIG